MCTSRRHQPEGSTLFFTLVIALTKRLFGERAGAMALLYAQVQVLAARSTKDPLPGTLGMKICFPAFWKSKNLENYCQHLSCCNFSPILICSSAGACFDTVSTIQLQDSRTNLTIVLDKQKHRKHFQHLLHVY